MLNKKLITISIILLLTTICFSGCTNISSGKEPIIIMDYLKDVTVISNSSSRSRLLLNFENERSQFVYAYRDDIPYYIGCNVTIVINYMDIDNIRVKYVQYIWNRDNIYEN